MNELAGRKHKLMSFRNSVMLTASALVMLGTACAADADEKNSPVVWIELGGQLERIDGAVERFSPHFFSSFDPKQLMSPLDLERPSRFGNGGEGSIIVQPYGSSWVYSASIRYGRAQSKRHLHQEYNFPAHPTITGNNKYAPLDPNVNDTATSDRESHTILDFQAGKDVGLGIFGMRDTSRLSVGIRMAEFHADNSATIYARPDNHFVVGAHLGAITVFGGEFHNYYATASSVRNFRGIGPSVEWSNSFSVLGDPHQGGIEFDWGVNAAVLFGRQKLISQNQTSAIFHDPHTSAAPVYNYSNRPRRSRSLVIPNVGAFGGLTYRVDNFKLSLGYRADLFLNAIDGGISRRASTDRDFYGPFINVGIGIGG